MKKCLVVFCLVLIAYSPLAFSAETYEAADPISGNSGTSNGTAGR